MSTTAVVGVMTRYIQPTLNVSVLNLGKQFRLGAFGLPTAASNSQINSFQKGPYVGAVELITPTNPLSYKSAIELHSKVASIFVQYDIKNIDSKYMNDYLKFDNKVLSLLKWLPASIKAIFGDVQVAIQSLVPTEVGDPVLEVKIASELPLDEAFDRNEKTLFQQIDDLYLANALSTVVITYA